MRTLGIVVGALTLALAACGGDDDDSTADTRDSEATTDTQDDDTTTKGRDEFCAALDQVEDAVAAGDQDAIRSGYRAMIDVVEDTGGDQLRGLLDDLRDAEGSGEFANALVDAANYCD